MMSNAEINYLSNEGAFRLFSLAEKEEKRFIQDFESKKDNLINEINILMDASKNSSFRKRSFVVSDNKIARIKGDLSYCKKSVCYPLKIFKIRSKQISETVSFSNVILSSKPKCMKSFSLSIIVPDRELKVKVNIIPDDNYMSILNRIVGEINNSGFGLYAEMVQEKRGRGVSNKIKVSGRLGKGNDFKIIIKGNSDFDNIFAEPITCAGDTEYELCGKFHTTSSDVIRMNKFVEIIPLRVGCVDLINKISVRAVISDIKRTIDVYNDLLELLMKNKKDRRISKEIMRAKSLTLDLMYPLSLMGIDITASGKLICNDKKFKSNIDSDFENVKKILGGDGGLADRILYMLKTSPIRNEHIMVDNPKGVLIVSYNNTISDSKSNVAAFPKAL